MSKRSELADHIILAIGWEDASTLFKHLGGLQILVPRGTERSGIMYLRIEELIGASKAKIFCQVFGGSRLTMPKCMAQVLAARNGQIVKDYDDGMSMLEMVQKYKLSERQIRGILNRPPGDSEGFTYNSPGIASKQEQMDLF